MSDYVSKNARSGKNEEDILVGLGNLIGAKIEHILPRE